MAEEEENEEQPVPETGAVFTFGRSRFADNVPNRFWIRNDQIKQVACGDEHTLLLTQSGRVFSFGANDWGQLGHGNSRVYTKPTSIKALKGTPASLVACGRSHSIVALQNGKTVAFGQNNDGQLGVGDAEPHHAPVEIEDLNDMVIVEATGGAQHSAVLTDSTLFVWGSNAEGQLGIPELGDEAHRPVKFKFAEQIAHVSCGYYHTAIVTKDGNLFTFGEGELGKLGHPVRRNEMVKEPRLVDISDQVVGVSCGGRHTIAVTRTGEVYVFGDGSDGQLGLGEGVTQLEGPRQLDVLNSEKIVHVACGESHSAAISDRQQIYLWGNDQYGKLGIIEDLNDHHNKYFEPRRLQKFSRFQVLQVSCGGCHTIILARPCSEQEDSAVPERARKERHNNGWNEQEKENIELEVESDDKKLPKLVGGDSEALNDARARRRRQLSQSNAQGSRDQPSSLADRALSISADVHRSLNGKFEKENGDSDEESSAFKMPETNVRRDSNTEMLHREINKNLSVFCRGDAPESSGQKQPDDEDDTKNRNRTSVYSRQSIPIPTVPPTRITTVALKYANTIDDPSMPMSDKNRYIVHDEETFKSMENKEENVGGFEGFDDEDDQGLSMLMDKKRSSHDSEVAEETVLEGKTVLDIAGSLPDVRPAFTETTTIAGSKKQGPIRRISGLIAKVKEAKGAKTNGESRACNIL